MYLTHKKLTQMLGFLWRSSGCRWNVSYSFNT